MTLKHKHADQKEIEGDTRLQNIEVRPYQKEDYKPFLKMFSTYFSDDLDIDLNVEKLETVCQKIGVRALKGISPLVLLMVEDEYAGFLNYQVDSEQSDWCE